MGLSPYPAKRYAAGLTATPSPHNLMSREEQHNRVALEALRVAKEAEKSGDTQTAAAARRQASKLASAPSVRHSVFATIRRSKTR